MSNAPFSGPSLLIRHTGQVFPLTQAPITMGRQADNTIVLSDPQASRQHATVTWRAGSYFVRDLDSANGTFVNEQRLSRPQPLRHGDILRLGNTIFDVRLEPTGSATEQGLASSPRRFLSSPALPVILGLVMAGIVVIGLSIVAILLLSGRGEPTVILQSPAPNAQLSLGSEIILQATATGARDITRLELFVDGNLVAAEKSPQEQGMATLTASQPWTFVQVGSHQVSAVAYTARERASDPASVDITVIDATGLPTPQETPTVLPSATPTVTVPTETPIPIITPTLTVTPTITPAPTEPVKPLIEYFRAAPEGIAAGACTLLEWGLVQNADKASIAPSVGDIGTPGSQTVCPEETTIYILTATGAGGTTTAAVTVTVAAPLPDLIVESITFDPSPPVQGQANQVFISIRNVGDGEATAFAWDWTAGADVYFDGRVAGLDAGESTLETVSWTPLSTDLGLSTVARADIDDQVEESDETNNEWIVTVDVVEPTLGDLELLELILEVDGRLLLRVSNLGGGITAPTYSYNIYEDDLLVRAASCPTPALGSEFCRTDYLIVGEHMVRVEIDPLSLIAESDKENNVLEQTCSLETLSCE